MDEEFLKKFVGKRVAIVGFGIDPRPGIAATIDSIEDGIIHAMGGDCEAYIDIDGIYCIIPLGD